MDDNEKRFYDYFDIDESLKGVTDAEIEKNYLLERDYMDAIKEGNLKEALRVKNKLESRVSKLRPRNLSLDERRCAYAVNRALSRTAAYEAGIPAPIIHRITTRESIIIATAGNSEKMEEACVQMLTDFCNIIKDIKSNQYSALVQSIIFTINQHYIEDISIADIAREHDISESYMIALFKKETGTTPALFLRDVRLKEASKLLMATDEKIQVISGKVGIADSNYFVKIFKAKYDMTPSEYRRAHKV